MVRHASRLPPNSKSLEEVVLGRIANGSAESEPTDRHKSSVAAAGSRRRVTPNKTADPTAIIRHHRSSHRSPPSGTVVSTSVSTVTIERIESLATELSQLNQRLVATHAPTATRQTSAPRRESSGETQPRNTIDRYITESMNDVYAAYATRKADSNRATAGKRLPAGSRAAFDPAHGAQVTHAVRELRSTVRRLDKVFYEVATGDKQRHLAATKISTLVRMFLARRRCRKMKYALGQWRARRCAALLMCLDQFSAREEFLNRQMARLDGERTRSLLRRVVTELRDVALLNLPMRRKRLDETERRFQRKQREREDDVWAAWKSSALGPRSRKRVTADAKARHTAARRRLETLARFDVITTEMVHEEFRKENIRVVRARHPFCVLQTYFRVLLHHVYLPMKLMANRAIAHERTKLLTLVWHAWLPMFRSSQVDRAIAKVNERRTLDRFETPHNLRRIDAHYRSTHTRKHLRAWAVYGQRIRRVRKLFEDTTKDNMTKLLGRWHIRAAYQRSLRAHAVEMWKAYGRRIFQTPFRAWYNFAASRRADRKAKESICVAYQRRQRRHTKYTFFRLWKHQVLFGNVEGIHSKVHLLRSLEDQKRLCLGLEHNAELYQQNIATLQQTIHALDGQLTGKQLELLALHDATQATRFSVHSAEQSIARVQGMLEAVRQVHPGTLARIEKMFAENPLLTQDLHDVVALHVTKRRQVMEQLALDDDELEIQRAAAAGAPHIAREDQLLLHRVKWVLSRLDLDTKPAMGHHQRKHNQEAMDQLCALFEFIRRGETAELSLENDPGHPRRAEDNGGRTVAREDLLGGSETWHAFLQALTVRFAPERMRMAKERLVKRADEMSEQLQELKANRQIYNAYSGSAHPKPQPPRSDGSETAQSVSTFAFR